MTGGDEQTGEWLRALRHYLGVSAGAHLVWEVLQLPLYTLWTSGTWREIGFAVLHCTMGDVLIAALVLVGALLVVGDPRWPTVNFSAVAATAVVGGIAYTVYSEWLNTVVRKSWAYSELMPIVPWLGTGMAPLMQWIVVPFIALGWVTARLRSGDHAR